MDTLQMKVNKIDNTAYSELFEYKAPFLEEKLLKSGKITSKDEFEVAFLELKKFFILNQISKKPLGMASKKIDEVWHQFILFTREYHSFCINFFGRFIHHLPNTSFTPIESNGVSDFVELYFETFGNIHEMWGINVDYDGAECTGCNTCSAGERTKKYTTFELASCSECNGCGTGGEASCNSAV